jgi:hypothetical protein
MHPQSWAVPFWATLHSTWSYAAPYSAMPHPTLLCCTLLSYAAPSEQWCIVCATVHPLGYTALLSKAACTFLNWATPWWTICTFALSELRFTLTKLPPFIEHFFLHVMPKWFVIQSLSHWKEKKCRCRNQSGTEIRKRIHYSGTRCSVIGLGLCMPQCWYRRHRPWSRCLAMLLG